MGAEKYVTFPLIKRKREEAAAARAMYSFYFIFPLQVMRWLVLFAALPHCPQALKKHLTSAREDD